MLKRIDNINEYFARSSAEDTFGNLVSKLQTFKDSKIKDLDAKSIGEILKVYCSDLGLNYAKIFKNKDTEDFNLEDFVDWFDASGTTGNFVFDFGFMDSRYPKLSIETLIKLIKLDDKLSNIVKRYAIKHNIITPDGREVTRYDADEKPKKGNVVPFDKLCRWVLVDMNSVGAEPITDLNAFTSTNLSNYSDKDIINPKLFNDTLKILKAEYEGRTSESLTEEKEDEVILDTDIEAVSKDEVDETESSADVDVEETEEKETEVTLEKDDPEISDAYMKTGIKELVNQLITDFWGVISKINSGITTIDYDFKGDEKESLLEILNNVADEATISVGMLSKASSLLDEKALKLMTQGEKKADKLIRK